MSYTFKTPRIYTSKENPYFSHSIKEIKVNLPPDAEYALCEILDGLYIPEFQSRYILQLVTLQRLRSEWDAQNG